MKLEVDVSGLSELLAGLRKAPDTAVAEVTKEMSAVTLLLLAHVKEDKLSGQVVNVVTGRLRRSITQSVTVDGNIVTGKVGTNVSYAFPLEFGFQGREQVNVFSRMTQNGKVSAVRAYLRRVTLPERSFLRSSLDDMKALIVERLGSATTTAITRALKGN